MIIANPAFSLSPNKLVLFTKFDRVYKEPFPSLPPRQKTDSLPLQRAFHNFELSANAYRSLRQKINWLYYASKKRDITTYSGKQIFSFRCAFITFTLPSAQMHPTSEITGELFNHCLTVLRQRYRLENYVWRLEFQKNGNVHYHLCTDSYIDFQAVRSVWNKVLESKGYVSAYTAKHSQMSLSQYVSSYSRGRENDFAVLAKRYALGCKEKWKRPNTVDVKSVVSKSAISAYVSKYFSKSAKTGQICNPLDNKGNASALRLWFCSRGLSKLKTVSDYLAHVPYKIEQLVRAAEGFKRVTLKYAVIYFFDLFKVGGYSRWDLESILREYVRSTGYRPCT